MRNLIKRLNGVNNVLIYGTEEILNTTCIFLNKFDIFCKKIIENQANIIDDLAIERLCREIDSTATLLVATKMEYQKEIMEKLTKRRISNAIFVTSELYNFLKFEYIKKSFEENGNPLVMLSDLSGDYSESTDNAQVKVFMVKSDKDKFLENKFDLQSWIIPIQAGSACANIKVAEVLDNENDNISDKNSRYCELTAMYWIWKNTNYKYTGLCHYRRHFVINEIDVKFLECSDIDVVLPTPSVCAGSVKEYYYRNHISSHWEAMIKLLCEKYSDYYETAKVVFDREIYYACNMLIAKKDIFDEYCSWLFGILFELEERCEPQVDKYQARYMGFLAERLTSLYFMHNSKKLKIVHAEKNFI